MVLMLHQHLHTNIVSNEENGVDVASKSHSLHGYYCVSLRCFDLGME